MSRSLLVAVLAAATLTVACSSTAPASPAPSPRPSPSPPPTQAPTSTPFPTLSAPPSSTPPPSATQLPTPTTVSQSPDSEFPSGSVIVTFEVIDEQFRVLLTDPADIATAEDLLAGKEAPSIPNGVVVVGDGGVNTGWSWHIDPATLDFADMTTEVCDGKPSFVENHEITGDRFCPWSAKVVAIELANP